MTITTHTKCRIWKGLWIASVVALILAWLGMWKQSFILGFNPELWLWTSLIFAALSLPVKLDCTNCTTCKVVQ